MGLRYHIEHKRLWLSLEQKEAYLKFAQEYIHWTKENWRYVEFSDEIELQMGTA